MSALAAWDLVPAPVAPAPVGAVPAGAVRRGHLQLVPAPVAPVRAGRVRLTRMGRAVVVALVVAVTVLLGTVLSARAAAAGPERTVTVRAGQTLSDVAAAELPHLPIAEGVARLQLANHLPSVQVRAGQALVVPHAG